MSYVAKQPRPPVSDADHRSRVHRDATFLTAQSYASMDDADRAARKRGYLMDRELSTDNTKVFMHRNTGRPVIAHRGSVTGSDWLVDDTAIAIGSGDRSPRHIKARLVTKSVQQKYRQPVDAVGHSLGGRLASRSGADGHVVTFNRAQGLGDILGGGKANDRHTHMRISGDPVSMLGSGARNSKTLPQTDRRQLSRLETFSTGSRLANIAQNAAAAHSLKQFDQAPSPS